MCSSCLQDLTCHDFSDFLALSLVSGRPLFFSPTNLIPQGPPGTTIIFIVQRQSGRPFLPYTPFGSSHVDVRFPFFRHRMKSSRGAGRPGLVDRSPVNSFCPPSLTAFPPRVSPFLEPPSPVVSLGRHFPPPDCSGSARRVRSNNHRIFLASRIFHAILHQGPSSFFTRTHRGPPLSLRYSRATRKIVVPTRNPSNPWCSPSRGEGWDFF